MRLKVREFLKNMKSKKSHSKRAWWHSELMLALSLGMAGVGIVLLTVLWPNDLSSNLDSKSISLKPALEGSNSQKHLTEAEKQKLAKTFLSPCTHDPCVWKAARELTVKYGPTSALDALDFYKQNYGSKTIGDSHEWAHVVGRQTAATYGISGKAFLLCPTTFNYGCMHGFFEKALGQVNSPREAIDKICGSFEKDSHYSPKFKFYCYHGVGHGVMQSLENNLKAALDVCNTIQSSTGGQDGCWQGVFMENINASIEGDAQPGVFLPDDPLAPCSRLEIKYQHECYINHSAYLLKFYNFQINPAAAACLKAEATQIEACAESIGLMVTNETWQTQLNPRTSGDLLSVGWHLCQQFPASYIQGCVMAGVDHILQMDELKTTRANTFCQLVGKFKPACYGRLGTALKAQTIDNNQVANLCEQLSSEGQEACLMGAGV